MYVQSRGAQRRARGTVEDQDDFVDWVEQTIVVHVLSRDRRTVTKLRNSAALLVAYSTSQRYMAVS